MSIRIALVWSKGKNHSGLTEWDLLFSHDQTSRARKSRTNTAGQRSGWDPRLF